MFISCSLFRVFIFCSQYRFLSQVFLVLPNPSNIGTTDNVAQCTLLWPHCFPRSGSFYQWLGNAVCSDNVLPTMVHIFSLSALDAIIFTMIVEKKPKFIGFVRPEPVRDLGRRFRTPLTLSSLLDIGCFFPSAVDFGFLGIFKSDNPGIFLQLHSISNLLIALFDLSWTAWPLADYLYRTLFDGHFPTTHRRLHTANGEVVTYHWQCNVMTLAQVIPTPINFKFPKLLRTI